MYGLNSSGGENRIKCRKLRQRIDEVDIDVVHEYVKVDTWIQHSLLLLPWEVEVVTSRMN